MNTEQMRSGSVIFWLRNGISARLIADMSRSPVPTTVVGFTGCNGLRTAPCDAQTALSTIHDATNVAIGRSPDAISGQMKRN